jgi:xanthine/uracil permease
MAKPKGHPILGVISGLLFGLFLSVTLTVYASVPFDSVVYIILVAAGLVVGVFLGWTGPFRRKRTRPAHVKVPQPPPRPEPAG